MKGARRGILLRGSVVRRGSRASRPNGGATAFTLIEMMLVVLVMGLLASAAALSFARPMRAARWRDAIEMVRAFDANSREQARRFGRGIGMGFDLAENRVVRREEGRVTYQASLPAGVKVREVRTAARRAVEGEIEIPCSRAGATRTYAVHLTGSGMDQWLLVSGLGGEISTIKDEGQLDSIFAATATRRDSQSAAQGPLGDDAD